MSKDLTVEEAELDDVEEAELEDSKSSGELDEKKPVVRKKEKNPNRVKQGFKLAAIGQRAKEEKMKKRVQEEMIKPTTWVTVGAVIASVGFLGLYFSPLFKNTEKDEPQTQQPEKKESSKPKSKGYFD